MAAAVNGRPVIMTNIQAENAYMSLFNANREIAQRQLKLSTGKRINTAADDVAGYITSRSLQARNRALKAALNATGNAKNVTAITQDALDNVTNLLTGIKDSAATAASGSIGTDEVVALAKAAYRLAEQIQLVADTSVFGGKQLFDGAFTGNWILGYNANSIPMQVGIDLTTHNRDYGTASGAFSLKIDAQAQLTTISTVSQEVVVDNGPTLPWENGLPPGIINIINNSLPPGFANRLPPGIARRLSEFLEAINNNQTTASNQTTTVQYVSYVNTQSVGIFAGVTGLNLKSLNEVSISDLGVFSSNRIAATLTSLTMALSNVTKVASYLGGIQRRLSSQEELLQSQMTNYTAAISRIEDADVAQEQLNLLKAQFLQNISLISLTQASQNPRAYMQLFQ